MKNILHIVMVFLILLPGFQEKTIGQTLYPVTALDLVTIEDAVYAQWTKPLNSSGQVPAGLIGYKVYRNGALFSNINDPDTVFIYDMTPDSAGMYTYGITAYYDMTPYGNPGIFQESAVTEDSIMVYLPYRIMPFFEPWDEGNFSFHEWRLEPQICNWSVNTSYGNPSPAATFQGMPAVMGYDHLLLSCGFKTLSIGCMKYFFEFDYKLDDISADSNEILTAGIYDNSIWTPVASFKNKGSTNWNHVSLDLTNILYSDFKIGLSASGVNSSHISRWMVDNIHLYGICEDPQNLTAELSGNVLQLAWDPVSCTASNGLAGYDVYRTDASGNAEKLNSDLLVVTEFTDYISQGTSAVYRYNVIALYQYPNEELICVSAGADTVTISYISGLNDLASQDISVSPNPSETVVTIASGQPINRISIIDPTGNVVGDWAGKNKKNVNIRVSDIRSGLYFLRIYDSAGKPSVRKLLINH